MLVFRGQNLSPVQHVEAIRIFDEPCDHPLWTRRHADSRLVYTFDLEKAGNADTARSPGANVGRSRQGG